MRLHASALLAITLTMAAPVRAEVKNHEAIKAAGAGAAGAAAGAGAFALIGGGGLAIAGTAVAIGAAPFVAAGAVIGVAGYGIHRLFSDGANHAPQPINVSKGIAVVVPAERRPASPVQKTR